MPSFRIRPLLITLHRWIGLILAPVFLVVILSGAVLSFRPILAEDPSAPVAARVDGAALAALVGKLEAGGRVNAVAVADGGRALDVTSQSPDLAGRWDIASGARTAAPSGGPDVFRTAEQLHKSLLLGLNIVVEVATFAMLGIMIAGPFLVWLRFRNTLIGWHTAVGWCLLPLTLLSPLTGVLMTLGIDTGSRPALRQAERPVSLSQALAIAGRDTDTSGLVSARRFRGGTVLLQVAGEGGGRFVVTEKGTTALTGGPGLMKQIHEGTWGGAWSGSLNFVVSLALLGLTVTGFVSWYGRWRRNRAAPLGAGADILVAHASQTGTAARLAAATRDALVAGGETAALAPLGAVAAKDLARFRTLLLIASTTGDGDVPDGARSVAKGLPHGALDGVRFAVLGLGDSSYARFCRGAETLREALLAAGGTEAVAFARADRDPAEAWRGWLRNVLAQMGLKGAAPALAPLGEPVELTLAERHRMDDPAEGETQETWCVTFASDRDLAFRPGDLVRLSPPDGGPERAYSIGSSSRVDPRRIALTVRLHRWQDEAGQEGFGRMSGRLVREAPVGSRLAARIDPHPGFNPPADPQWPIVMIGAGSGIAPYPGFVAERQASGKAGPAWLIFGNRHRKGDFLWQGPFEAAMADGALTRLDTAFSRDADDGSRVQDRLRQASDEVRRWILDRKAVIYVCGRREMVQGVKDALAGILAAGGSFTAAAAAAEIDRWLGEGRLRVDAFD